MAGTPFDRRNTRTIIFPAPPAAIAPLLPVGKMGPTLLSIEFSTHTKFLATPANPSCSVAHQLQEKLHNVRSLADQHTETSETPSAPSGLPGQTRPGEPKIVQQYNEVRFFYSQTRNKPETFNDDHTESCGHVDPLRGCHGAIPAEIWLCLKSGSYTRTLLIFLWFVAELFLIHHKGAVHWPFYHKRSG